MFKVEISCVIKYLLTRSYFSASQIETESSVIRVRIEQVMMSFSKRDRIEPSLTHLRKFFKS